MWRGKTLIVMLFVAGFFIFFKNNAQGSGGVVINEFVPTGSENVELFNNTASIVDLDNWMIGDVNASGTNKKCLVLSGIILPREWRNFVLGSGCLNDSSSDSVVLKNKENEVIDRYDYNYVKSVFPKDGYSMALLIDGDSSSGWALTPSTTPGAANIFPVTIPDPEPTSTTVVDWNAIKINEFMSDPAEGNEWVEFFNNASTSADLAGGSLCDNRETTGCLSVSGIIPAFDWLLFDIGTKSFLNNGGDSVVLKNPSSEVVDRVDYDELPPAKGNSLARKIDGIDSDNLSDWAETTLPTLSAANEIVVPANSGSNNSGNKKETTETEEEFFDSTSTYFGQIVFNEILAAPDESSNQQEFLEIKNLSSFVLNLSGWTLVVGNKNIVLNDLLFLNETKAWYAKDLNFSLNNSGGEIKLYDQGGYLATSVSYGKTGAGVAVARKDDDEWGNTSVPTPGEKNIFLTQSDSEIFWKIKYPESARIGRVVEFDVSESLDPRGGVLSFSWELNDQKYFGDKLSWVFDEAGEYEIKIIATSTAGTVGQKEIVLVVGEGLVENNSGVGLSEICPSPLDGQENEFIEIYNYGLETADISGWRLRYDGQEYIFPTDSYIASGSYAVFPRTVSKLYLKDTEGFVELLANDLGVLDEVLYEVDKKGECMIWFGGDWQNTVSDTSREKNLLTFPKQEIKKEIVKKTASKKSGILKAVSGIKEFSLAMAREQEKGVMVSVSGVVSVLPGILGSQFFYIFDGESGMQVYQNKKIFPELREGDRVAINGVMSEASGRKRINVKNLAGFDILAVENKVVPIKKSIADLSDELLGALISVSGEVTELKSSLMYLDDGTGEVVVYFKPGAQIDKKILREGMKVEVAGIYENSSSGDQIWPRSMNDIKIVFVPASEDPVYQMKTTESNMGTFRDYLTAILGGLSALGLGLILRERKKVIEVVRKMVKK